VANGLAQVKPNDIRFSDGQMDFDLRGSERTYGFSISLTNTSDNDWCCRCIVGSQLQQTSELVSKIYRKPNELISEKKESPLHNDILATRIGLHM
jgi:hypothetical protein